MKRIEHKIIDGVELKLCGKCKNWKPLSCFNKNKNKHFWDCLENRCKDCKNQCYIKHGRKKIKHVFIDDVECKYCYTCKEWKTLDRFGKNNRNSDKLQCICKKCKKQYDNVRSSPYYKLHREERILYGKKYYIDNFNCFKARSAKRKADQKNLTPPDADLKAIRFIYSICAEWNRLQLNDFTYEIDHIKPKAKGGQHHEDNLQILPAFVNREKSAKWPLTPEQEIKYKGFRI